MERLDLLVSKRVSDIAPFRATVASVSGGMVTLHRLGVTTAETELRARVQGVMPAVGDEVLCVVVNHKPVVVGKVQRAAGPSAVLEPSLRSIVGIHPFGANVGMTDGLTKAHYIGRASDAYSSIEVTLILQVGGTTISWAEVGVGTSPSADLSTAADITTRGYTDVATPFASSGVKSVTIAVSGINPGDHLWMMFGASASVMPTIAASNGASGADWSQSGVIQNVTARMSTWTDPQTFSVGTGGTPMYHFTWQGTV